MSHGVQFLAAYTFSKSIDDAGDSLGSAFAGGFGVPILGQLVYNDQTNVASQRGVSDFDRTHRLVISGRWDVPGLERSSRAAVQKLGNGWRVPAIVTLQSGLPSTILDISARHPLSPPTQSHSH